MKSWVDIPGFGGRYQINRMGFVKNCNGKILRRQPHRGCLLTVTLTDNTGKRRTRSVPRLVAETFLDGVPEGSVAYCKNGDHNDCRPENIGTMTKAQWQRLTRHVPGRKPVASVDGEGNVLKIYSSATEAAEANYMSPSAVVWHAQGKYKGGGHSFRYVKDLKP